VKPLRFSALKQIAASPKHYRHALTVDRDTAAMRLGRLVHSKILGASPDGTKPIVVFGGKSRRGKEWESFRAENQGADIFLASENDKANAMSEAVRGDELAYDLIGAHVLGMREHTLRWTNGTRQCQGTPDLFNADLLVDVKSTRCAAPGRWTGQWGEIRKLGYSQQLSWYADAIETCGFPTPKRVSIVAVESVAPFAVTVFDIDETELEVGRRIVRGWLETLAACEAADHWPSYSQCPVRVVADDESEGPALIWGDDEEEEQAA
jgi:hypothetical protein